METKFKILSTILMFILISLLIGILVKYYNRPIIKDNEKTFVNTNLPKETETVVSVLDNSGEENIVSGENNLIDVHSGEIFTQESGDVSTHINLPTNEIIYPPKDDTVIISSESTMTNQEKKEILKSLDATLMQLLEVVDGVQTVDETRLITDESEVQQ